MEASVAPSPLPPAASLLRFDRTLPREDVHKAGVDQVFLTDIHVSPERRALAAIQLPRSHALFSEMPRRHHDLLLVIEAARQAMTLYGHLGMEIPAGEAFVMARLSAVVVDPDALLRGPEPARMVLDVPPSDAERGASRRGRLRRYRLRAMGWVDERPAVELGGDALIVPASLYEQVRDAVSGGEGVGTQPVPTSPQSVGREQLVNVVVGRPEWCDGRLVTRMVVPADHPTFFDHPLDHAPGMLMLEAARQAAVLAAAHREGWPPTDVVVDRCEVAFTQYVAFQPAAELTVTLVDDEPQTLTAVVLVSQDGEPHGEATLRLRRAA